MLRQFKCINNSMWFSVRWTECTFDKIEVWAIYDLIRETADSYIFEEWMFQKRRFEEVWVTPEDVDMPKKKSPIKEEIPEDIDFDEVVAAPKKKKAAPKKEVAPVKEEAVVIEEHITTLPPAPVPVEIDDLDML